MHDCTRADSDFGSDHHSTAKVQGSSVDDSPAEADIQVNPGEVVMAIDPPYNLVEGYMTVPDNTLLAVGVAEKVDEEAASYF